MINYILANLWSFWAVVAVVFLAVELTSGGFYLVCFSVGAVAAAIGALFGGFAFQLVMFILFSAVSLFTVRPFALKYLHRDSDNRPSNADALLGRVGIVSEPIKQGGYGRVAIDGDDWKAVSSDGLAIQRGDRVKVTGRESIIITVEKL